MPKRTLIKSRYKENAHTQIQGDERRWRKLHRSDDLQKKKKVWTCAKAKCIPLYNKKRANMKMLKKEAALDMLKTDPKHYCIAWFKTYTKCDFVDYCRELQ
jgi:hypothetical protein